MMPFFFAELAEASRDTVLLDEIQSRLLARLVLADKGYVGKQLNLKYAAAFNGELLAVSRANSKEWKPNNPQHKRARRYVEIVFSQVKDEVRNKVNRAKRYSGLEARVVTKLLTRTMKKWLI